MIFTFSVPSLRLLSHAYNAIAKLTSITNVVVTSFVVNVLGFCESQSVGSVFASSPSGGICWLR